MASKLPFIQFFVDDWLSEERLRICSLAARGLWMDLLCLMHKGGRRGFLIQANGQPMTHEQIARLTGCSSAEVAHLCQELITSGAASANEHGIIFNRRMVRDEEIRQLRSAAGAKGGNPVLLKQRVKQTSKQKTSKPMECGSPLERGELDGGGKTDAPTVRSSHYYFPHLAGDASEVVEFYDQCVDSAHASIGAENVVIEILGNKEATKEELLLAIPRWAKSCKEANQDRTKRMGAANWFRAGGWKKFLGNGPAKPKQETMEEMAIRIDAENKRNLADLEQ